MTIKTEVGKENKTGSSSVLSSKQTDSHTRRYCANNVLCGSLFVSVRKHKEQCYFYYYYIHLTAFFQDNLGKTAPER